MRDCAVPIDQPQSRRHSSSFIGRASELALLTSWLADDAHRLITLTGVGGIGKTRLAQAALDQVAAAASGSVCEIELAPLLNADLIAAQLADALQIPGTGATIDGVVEALRDQRLIVLFDNCEHLVDGVASIAVRLIDACPRVKVLATSRIVLGLTGETVLPVRPLSTVRSDSELSEAGQLFRARAPGVGWEPEVTPPDVVEKIVADLDGIPLAIELAAGRTRVLTPQEIAARSGDYLELLSGGPRDASPRHQTMRASLDLSLDLLSDADRQLFAELSVFAGTFTLDAVEAVCEGGSLARLIDLVDQSMLHAEHLSGETRFHFPEFVRQYAAALLTEAQRTVLELRHREYFLALAEQAHVNGWAFSGSGHVRLENDLANLRRAHDHACRAEDEDALRLVRWLDRFWREAGHAAEGIVAAQSAINAVPYRRTAARAFALNVLAGHLLWHGDISRGFQVVTEAVAIAEETGDLQATAVTLARAGSLRSLSDPEDGRQMLIRSLAIATDIGDLVCQSDSLTSLTNASWFKGNREAEIYGNQSLEVAEAVGSHNNLRWTLCTKAFIALWLGHGREARAFAERGKRLTIGEDPYSRSTLQGAICVTAAFSGHPDMARKRAWKELAACQPGAVTTGTGLLFYALSVCALADDDAVGAMRELTRMDAPEFAVSVLRALAQRSLITAAVRLRDADIAFGAATALAQIAESVEDRRHSAIALQGMAEASLLAGDIAGAESLAKDALSRLVDQGWVLDALCALETLAEIAARTGEGERAARYLGAVDSARKMEGLVRLPPDPDRWRSVTERARAACGDPQFEAAYGAGRRTSIGEASDYALRNRGARRRPGEGWYSLTPIERKVAELAASGMTNPDIAREVFASRSTVKMHLSHVYTKLGVNSRIQLARQIPEAAERMR
jgi:predicted ATPase/DNA-binding CsgD family transcriptional regulator